jgi:phosphoglycolate phosphatase-like HAD superfamily hydrolase
VYVGDSKVDREAAESAGMHFIGVGHRVEYHRLIPALADLPPAIEQLIASLS